jgi:hypothetical protein
VSSLSAAIFVNVNTNLASAKKSSRSSGGDSNDTGNGDLVSSNGDGSSDRTTTTPTIDQGNTGLSTTTTSTTTTPTSQQQQPDNSNCNTKLMIGCVTGGSVQCIVAPCGPSSTTSTNAVNSINGSVTGGLVQCIVAPCGPSSTTSTNGSPLTPQQQYQQCAMGIGGAIPGNCKPPASSTTSEQNFAPQTLTPQKCQLLPTDANGNCQRINMQDGSPGLPPPPQLGSQEKQQATFNLPNDLIVVKQLPDGSCPVDYYKINGEINGRNCVIKAYPENPDGSCPGGTVKTKQALNACVKMPVLPGTSTGSTGGGFIQMFPTPPATSPNNTSPYLPPPSTK